MFAGIQQDHLCLGSVRCRGSGDALRERRRVEAAMSHFDVESLGLPRQALLITRRIAPRARLGPDGRTSWFAEVVRSELLARLRGVCRPWLYGNAEAAEAVLFLDEAELAACLIRDWLRNQTLDHWWWRFVLGSLSASEWVRRRVLVRGELLAAATELLAPAELAVAWYRRIGAIETSRAWSALGQTYGIGPPASIAAKATNSVKNSAQRSANNEPTELDRMPALANLLRVVPEILSSDLPANTRTLLAAVLVVRRQLQWARSPALADALAECGDDLSLLRFVRQPSGHAAKPSDGKEEPRRRPRLDQAPAGEISRIATDTPAARDIGTQEPDSILDLASPREPQATQPLPAKAHEKPGTTEHAGERLAHYDEIRPLPAMSVAPGDGSTSTEVGTAPSREDIPFWNLNEVAAAPSAPIDPPDLLAESIATRFGGIFYLLNAALALGLYGDFSMPRHKGLELSPWDWLAMIGWRWFGDEFRKDPVWNVLAELAGHPPRRRPELGFRPPGRKSVKRWFAEMSAQLIARLERALGTDGPTGIPDQACRYPAHIYKSASAVDVHLSLNDLPISLRICGLDRDPGWIPAAGRSIRFHFE